MFTIMYSTDKDIFLGFCPSVSFLDLEVYSSLFIVSLGYFEINLLYSLLFHSGTPWDNLKQSLGYLKSHSSKTLLQLMLLQLSSRFCTLAERPDTIQGKN